ncbi:MAG: hypothetical protein WCT37_00445 [Patescibacteria group bacterium]|jgi:hypothetical protein
MDFLIHSPQFNQFVVGHELHWAIGFIVGLILFLTAGYNLKEGWHSHLNTPGKKIMAVIKLAISLPVFIFLLSVLVLIFKYKLDLGIYKWSNFL